MRRRLTITIAVAAALAATGVAPPSASAMHCDHSKPGIIGASGYRTFDLANRGSGTQQKAEGLRIHATLCASPTSGQHYLDAVVDTPGHGAQFHCAINVQACPSGSGGGQRPIPNGFFVMWNHAGLVCTGSKCISGYYSGVTMYGQVDYANARCPGSAILCVTAASQPHQDLGICTSTIYVIDLTSDSERSLFSVTMEQPTCTKIAPNGATYFYDVILNICGWAFPQVQIPNPPDPTPQCGSPKTSFGHWVHKNGLAGTWLSTMTATNVKLPTQLATARLTWV